MFCCLDPLAHIGGFRPLQWHAGCQCGEGLRQFADDSFQRPLFHFQIVERGNLAGIAQVVTCLGFMAIGDGGGANLEVHLRLRQLLRNSLFLRLCQRHGVLRQQGIEISLRNAQYQILLGRGILHFGLGCEQFALFVLRPVLTAVNGLGQPQRGAVGVVAVFCAGGCGARFESFLVPAGIGRQVERRQQASPGLRQFFLARLVSGFRGRQRGIAGQRLAVYIHQVGGIGRRSESCTDQ